MKIVLNLNEENVRTIRKARALAGRVCRSFAEKEDREGLSEPEVADYADCLDMNALLIRTEAIVDDRMIEAEERRKETEMKISAEVNDGKMDVNLAVDEEDVKNADALCEFLEEFLRAAAAVRNGLKTGL